jgi:hypothetical protein
MLDRYGVMKVMYYTVCHGVSGSNRYCSEFLLLKICVREKMAYSSQVEFLKFELCTFAISSAREWLLAMYSNSVKIF